MWWSLCYKNALVGRIIKMYIKEKKKVTKYLERIVKTKCDICEKEIPNFEIGKKEKSRFFRVTTGHNDWGNDSCDSIEEYAICTDCIQDFVKNYIKKVNGTEYINIETYYASEEKYFDEEYDEEGE